MNNQSGSSDDARNRAKHRKWPRYVLWIVAISVVLGAPSYVVYQSEGFQKCVCDGENNNAAQDGQKQKSSTIIIACVGTFLQDNNGAVSAITGLLIALFTGTLWWATKRMQDASIQQSIDMQRSIAESARAADAMEGVARSFADNVEILRDRIARQMRAYVCVVVSGATYQDKNRGLKFAGIPMMLNTGNTPAYKVSFKATTDILPIPLPENFGFPLPDEVIGSGTLGPHQSFTMNIVVQNFCDDADVMSIMRVREGKGLYVWGVINYEDVLGDPHYTRFCQLLSWVPIPTADGRTEERPYGVYSTQHNDAD